MQFRWERALANIPNCALSTGVNAIKSLQEEKALLEMLSLGDPWVVQRFSARLWPRAQSWNPRMESRVGLPAWSLLPPPPVSLLLSLSHK